MKQSETKAVALSDASAVLRECSNTELYRLPLLLIMTPYRFGCEGDHPVPAMSVRLQNDEVRALYDLLHVYYSENRKPS